jgi:hypothetical protein
MCCGLACEVRGVGDVGDCKESREFSSSFWDCLPEKGPLGGKLDDALSLLRMLLTELPYSSLRRGRRVGIQAQIIPTDCSMEDQVEGITLTYVVLSSVLKSKLVIRRTETTQTLVYISKLSSKNMHNWRDTYKPPSRNMPVRIHFCRKVVCKRHAIGYGRQRIKTSKSILPTPFHRKKAISLIHLPEIVESQSLEIGEQPAIVAITQAM